MKKAFLFLLLLSAIGSQGQTVLYNGGSVLQINEGAVVNIDGSFENKAGSTFVNNGTVLLKGNFTNDQVMDASGTGSLKWLGTNAQTLNGSAPFIVWDLVLDNSAGLTINNLLKIVGTLAFKTGVITATNATNPVIFGESGIVSTLDIPSDASHINGYVVKQGTGAFTYPVGDGVSYQPVSTTLTANESGMQVRYMATDAGAGAFSASGSEAVLLEAYNEKEYWDISPLSTATGSVTLHWDEYNALAFSEISKIRVAHNSGGEWLNEGGSPSGTATSGSITSNDVSTWSPFTLGKISSTLPVTLVSFQGRTLDNGVNLLSWRTANEKDFSHFEVQHSSDAFLFVTIGSVPGMQSSEYTFTETSSQSGMNYYRLKMVDRDGSFAFSRLISITNKGKGSLVSNFYPNPSTGIAFVDIKPKEPGLWTITGYDLSGKILSSRKQHLVAGINKVQVNLQLAGLKVYRFEGGSEVVFRKVVRD